jgi:hypothetical protein
MSNADHLKNKPKQQAANTDHISLPGYPSYPSGEDVFEHHQIEEEVDPENITQHKVAKKPAKHGSTNETNYENDFAASDLDIPGAELDDAQELIGSEDEENNFYSLGGDNHSDLDESHED